MPIPAAARSVSARLRWYVLPSGAWDYRRASQLPNFRARPAWPGVARDLGLCCGFGVQAILQGMRWRLVAVAAGLVVYGRLVRAGDGRAVAVAMAADGAGAARSRSVTPPGGPGGRGRRLVAGSWLRAHGLIPAGVTCGE